MGNNQSPQKAFGKACIVGDINMMKTIYGEYDIDIHYNNEYSFVTACKEGHLEIAKWLWDISDHTINIHVSFNEAFLLCCYNGHESILNFLLEIEDNIENFNDTHNLWEAFYNACQAGHLKIAQTLWNIAHQFIDLRNSQDMIFNTVCLFNKINVAKWLTEICEDYSISVDNNNNLRGIISNKLDRALDLYNRKRRYEAYNLLGIVEKDSHNTTFECLICKSIKKHIINLPCKHLYCPLCLFTWEKQTKKYACCYCNNKYKWDACFYMTHKRKDNNKSESNNKRRKY